jgi:hypothetical protein
VIALLWRLPGAVWCLVLLLMPYLVLGLIARARGVQA